MKLLTTANAKIKKGEKQGYMSFGIHLAPAKQSGFNVCPSSSKGCEIACLSSAGHGAFSTVQDARNKKTVMFFKDRENFMNQLVKEISAAIKKAEKNEMTPCFRLNLTSDLAWEKIKHHGKTIMEHFPKTIFYDYSAVVSRMSAFLSGDFPENYHLTFSRKESNDLAVQAIMASGGNVAAVFRGALPDSWMGRKVIDSDENDLRFLDPKGVICGLSTKGKAKKDKSGFVLEPSNV
jgi:hypothetical protein